MNSSLTSPTNTQIFRARCPRVSPLSASLTLSQSQPSQCLSHDGDRPSRTNLQDALSTTMSGLPTITNAPALMVTRHGFSCIQPSATSLSLVLDQEPAVQLLALNTRHLYSSQACLQRFSSWPAHMSFQSLLKCSVINCSVSCFHRESGF
jgi:hypothetical protein